MLERSDSLGIQTDCNQPELQPVNMQLLASASESMHAHPVWWIVG